MFHTFSTGLPEPTSSNSKQSGENGRRSSTVNRACDPCRRRKVKCSGDLPCETCRWYRKSAQCHYADPGQRAATSKRPGEKGAQILLDQYRIVFQKLFPNLLPEQLIDLSRESLVDLITKDSPRRFLQPTSPRSPLIDETTPNVHPDADSLETFQPMPDEGSEASDRKPSRALQGVQDDVNALSLSVKQTSSYLGISSVIAVFRVIAWLDPEAQTVFRRTPEASLVSSRDATSPSTPIEVEDLNQQVASSSSSAWDEIPQINSYFTYFHPMVPLLDEQSFRDTYITRRRSDPRWLLLLNIVLSLGSAVNTTASASVHRLYYARARQHINLETFGSAHLETVQALALLSGYYLHYLQLPNQAHSLMGTTLRLAAALGLHRDYSGSVALSKKEKTSLSIELRRRVWWCIFCLDSWACGPLGRPSMGRMSHAVNAKIPQQPIGNSVPILTLLQENIQFAAISTKVEDALAFSPMVDENERKVLDTTYVDWFKASSVHDNTPRPSMVSEAVGISVTKNIMRWRYLWARVVLHRPVLLWYAMRKVPFSKLSSERQATIELCRELTGDLINDIALTWTGRSPCVMSGWHATWLLYQATMVPLLSLFSDKTDQKVLEKSHSQIQTSMRVLSDQINYAHTAKRSLEVITLIYEAGTRHRPDTAHGAQTFSSGNVAIPVSAQQPATIQPPRPDFINLNSVQEYAFSRNLNTPQQEMIMDTMFDSLNWSNGWTDEGDDFVEMADLGFSFDYMNTGDQNDQQQYTSMSLFEPTTFDSDQMG